MKSLQIKKIDGFDVVVGFQNRPIDPVATQNKNRKSAYDLPESLELRSKNDKQNNYRLKLIEARKNAKAYLFLASEDRKKGISDTTNKSESAKQDKIANDLVGTMNTTNEELKVLSVACKKACEKILTDNPVYNDKVEFKDKDDKIQVAGPRQGEVIKTQADIDDLTQKFKDKPVNTQLMESGEYVDDFRGKIFHYKDDEMTNGKWTKGTIDSLGDKLEIGKFEEDLTDSEKTEIAEQENTDRLAAMTPEDREAEYSAIEEGLAERAYDMKGKLEIRGSSAAAALAQSQDFYNTELTKLKLEYGVEL